jgi:hypothetical protein
MAIDKLTPRYLNFEDDERLVKRVEMTDAVNVRIDSDDDGNAGVVKNVAGNTLVTFIENDDGIPSGDNKVIGSVHNNVKGEILFFVHNSANNHRIYKYDDNLEKVITVYKNEATGAVAPASADTLGFKATDYVDAAVLVDKDGDTLLYFTNGRGEPKKINVDKAIRGDYPDGYEGVEAYISLIKKPPLEAPTFNILSNESLSTNRILGKQFQFACQYVYDDGEVSAISPISGVTKPRSHSELGIKDKGYYRFFDNEVEIFCKRTNSDIRKIRFLARNGNDGVFFIVKDVNTSESITDDVVSVKFSNEKIYTPISNNENNKLFDSVGEDAKSITISGNRIFLGNYTEGFSLDVDVDTTITNNYHSTPEIFNNYLIQTGSGFWSELTGLRNGLGVTSPASGFVNNSQKAHLTHLLNIDIDELDDADTSRITNFYINLNASFNVQSSRGTGYKKSNSSDKFSRYGVLHKTGVLSVKHEIPITTTTKTSIRDEVISFLNKKEYTVGTTFGAAGQYRTAEYGADHDGELTIQLLCYPSDAGNIEIFFKPIRHKLIPLKSNFREFNQTITHPRDRWDTTNYKGVISVTAGSNYAFGDIGYDGNTILLPESRGSHNVCLLTNGEAQITSFFEERQDDELKSFKADANHSFGIVYQDKNGRLSTVYPAGETYVDWFDSENRRSLKGRTSVVMRVNHTPPSNAVRWYPVYSGNTSIGNFIQYTVNNAYLPSNTGAQSVPTTDDSTDKLYVSMRGFEGKENSYKESYNPKISYSFADGDEVKIISVDEEKTYNQEYDVLGYDFLTTENNPLTSATTGTEFFEKTGYFLVIRKPSSDFSFQAGTANTDPSLDNNNFANKCLIEIRSPKYGSDNPVYYELGKGYDIENGSHVGDVVATSLTDISVTTNTAPLESSGDVGITITTSVNGAYAGDTWTVTSSGETFDVNIISVSFDTYSGRYTIRAVHILQTPTVLSNELSNESGTMILSSVQPQATIKIDSGDVYYRKRILFYGTEELSKNRILSFVDYVEDYRINDFISKASNDFGKPNAFSEEASRIHRNSSITYSDAHVMDSDRLSLSSFNNSLANFLDIKNKYGAIQRMVDIEDAFYAVQEHKVTLFPVNRNVLQSAAGDATVTLSTDVVNLNSSKSFAGDYGCGNDPEAVVYFEGVLYFVDRKANKVFSISSSGIKEISDIFADSYIADKLSGADKGGEYNIYSGIDPNNDEYLLSTRTIVNKTISVDQGSLYVLPANSGVGQADFTPHSVNSTTFGNFNLLNFNFEDVDVTFEDMGNGVLYVDDGFSDNAMQLDTPVDNLTSGTSNIVYTDKGNTFLGVAQVDNTSKFVELDPS